MPDNRADSRPVTCQTTGQITGRTTGPVTGQTTDTDRESI